SLPPSRAVKIESLRPSASCLHHVDNHSCVRKTQADALDSRSVFHSSRSSKNSSAVSIRFTIMPAAPGEAAGFLWPCIQPPQVSRPGELESQASDGGEIRRPIRHDGCRDHRYSRTQYFRCPV